MRGKKGKLEGEREEGETERGREGETERGRRERGRDAYSCCVRGLAADSQLTAHSLAAVVSPRGSLTRVLPSLPPSLFLSSSSSSSSCSRTHTHTFTHIYIECLCSVFSVWNVCLLTGRHGEQLCGQTGERDCSEALERAGYTSTFLSLSSAAFTVSRRLVLSTSRALKLFTAASLFFSELALLLARL